MNSARWRTSWDEASNRPVATLLVALALPIFAPSAAAAPIPETAWSRCTAMQDDGQRLACFDELSAAARSARPKKPEDREAVLNTVIRRCRKEMSSYGSSIIKACVEQDMAAYLALKGYPAAHASFINRCKRDMSEYGWAIIKACADQDIAAERALRQMGKQ